MYGSVRREEHHNQKWVFWHSRLQERTFRCRLLHMSGALDHGGSAALPEKDYGEASVDVCGRRWRLRRYVELIEVLSFALLMFLLVRSASQNFVIYGDSMAPTFRDGEMLIVNKFAYRTFDISWVPFIGRDDWTPFGSPSPGDIIVFKSPGNPARDFIKRVIAVPGQTVEVRDGLVFVNGVVRYESYLSEPPVYKYDPVTVPTGQLFVLGDNRNNSYDSHSWGMLDQALIIGRADVRYWPFDRIEHLGGGGTRGGKEVSTSWLMNPTVAFHRHAHPRSAP